MRILITGVTGFAGCHLLSFLGETKLGKLRIVGLSRRGKFLPGFEHLSRTIRLERDDLQSVGHLLKLLRAEKPDRIFHFAGYTDAARSFREPAAAWQGNWRTAFTLFRAIQRWGARPRVLVASSAAVYGNSVDAVTEESTLLPVSPYGVSKAAADLLAGQAFLSDGIPTVRARLFNVCGPGLPSTFALGAFVSQIVAIERGQRPPVLKVGDLTAERDYLPIRVVVRAYWDLVEKGVPGDAYNLASGKTYPMRQLLNQMLKLANQSIQIEPDPSRLRGTEVMRSNVDVSKLRRAIGWRPSLAVRQDLQEMLEHARWHQR